MKAVCIATGSSLTPEDVDYCRGKATIYAVKEAYLYAPWADHLHAADCDWWVRNKGLPDFLGKKYVCDQRTAQKYGLTWLEYDYKLPWSTKAGVIATGSGNGTTGGNSGFQAMNLAALHGATEIILIGYDCGHKKGSHEHFWHDKIKREHRETNYNWLIKGYHNALPHIKIPVYNASRFSYLTAFPRVNLHDVL